MVAVLGVSAKYREHLRGRFFDDAGRARLPKLPDLLERHAVARDVAAVLRETGAMLSAQFAQACLSGLSAYVQESTVKTAEIELLGGISYDRLVSRTHTETTVRDATSENGRIRQATADDISHERMYAALEVSIHAALTRLANQALRQCRASLGGLDAGILALDHSLSAYRHDLRPLKQKIRRT